MPRDAIEIGPSRMGAIIFCVVCVIVGCKNVPPQVHLPPPYTVYRSPNLLEAPPRRILLMPPVAPPQHMNSANIWNEQLANELRSIRKFEVVRANPALAPVANCLASIQRGQYSESALIELRNSLRVDGILFVSFHDCYAYWPPRISVAVNLVETQNGETVAALDGNWDARDETTKMQAIEYAKRVTTIRELADPDVVLESPHYFGKYVAADIAHGLCMLWNPEEQPADLAAKDGNSPGDTSGASATASLQTGVSPNSQEVGAMSAVAGDAAVSASQEESLPPPANP